MNAINNAGKADYSFDNASQGLNTLGNRFKDLREISALGREVCDGINAGRNIYLTTEGNATFSGVNVEGNQLIFDIAGYLVRRSTKC